VKRAVIVGGGLIGVELAEMLATRDIAVTMLVRESRFWGNVLPKEEGDLVGRHLAEHHIDVRYGNELKEILADDKGRCRAVITSSGEEIECQVVGLTAGVRPNVDFLKGGKLAIDRGILVDELLRTNIPFVYAAGDCVQLKEPQKNRRPIEAVWYTGKMMGEVLARTITGEPLPYLPGVWFNSAKFFDIEYQTYGNVPAELAENQTDFFWESSCRKKCVKLVFDADTHELYGVNVFGLRLRHQVLNRWLKAEKTVEHCLGYWKDAEFDPEFSKTYYEDMVNKFTRDFKVPVVKHKKKWLRIIDFYNS
jgi:NADPH-dependent 2,4-dienoyl-CoA reductase/sulfur reductase-like enzyme